MRESKMVGGMVASVPTLPARISSAELSSILDESSPKIVRISHPASGDQNLLRAAYLDDTLRSLVTNLAKHGYHLYRHDHGVSGLVRANVIPDLWHRVRSGEFSYNRDGLVYTYEPPKVAIQEPKLIVVFSSIYTDIFSPSLMRYFMRNFPQAQTVLTPGTGVLRIADIGGVVGGFYLPTTADPQTGEKVQTLIDSVAAREGVDPEHVVLYGASKGATAAVFHGLQKSLNFVAVDPIVSDEYYETKYRDSHFTSDGVFLASKQDTFCELLNSIDRLGEGSPRQASQAVIFSERSPQFEYISDLLVERLRDRALFLNSDHPEIMDHPDVARKTMGWAIMLLNMTLNGMNAGYGIRAIT